MRHGEHRLQMDDPMLEQAREGRRGPVEGEHVIGHDRDASRRPGVPMHARPAPRPPGPIAAPARQPPRDDQPHRAGLQRTTPVFGTAQPLHGLSGALRRAAYRMPEYHARHWMTLMAADRVDVLEDRIGALLAWPLRVGGARATDPAAARSVQSNPALFLAGALTGLLVTRVLLD
jgi:hypothetical protein